MGLLWLRWRLLGVVALALGLQHVPRVEVSRGAVLGGMVSASVCCSLPAGALNPMTDTKKKAGRSGYAEEGPSYLKEPTAEFKKAEAERAAFRQKQAAYKQQWDAAFATFAESASSDDDLVSALSKLSRMVAAQRGLPYGLRLTDMITQCRRVKGKALALGGWGTPVEIEYMNLVREVKRSENPNLEDTGYL